jgi:hypothetical protein
MSYLTQLYNWYWDIHPFRPTMKERMQKDLMMKQIRETKHFKLKPVARFNYKQLIKKKNVNQG